MSFCSYVLEQRFAHILDQLRHTTGGQPDSIAVSPDKTFAAIAIENERDEDLGDGELPQMPAGFLIIFDISSEDVTAWTMSKVEMTGLPGLYEDSDPEPEFVSINYDNIAVVTLQENNAIVLVDCATATVKESFSAGTVDLYDIDTEEEGEIDMSSNLTAVPREPDGVVWLGTSKYFATADEGDMLGGSRGFTIFNTDGDIVYTSGSEMEHIVAALGHYPEERSGNKGNEPENVAYGVYDGQELLFVNSERSSLVLIYDVSKAKKPKFLQALPAGIAPEGSVAIPDRGLLVVASEKDDRDNKVRSVLNIYAMSDEKVPQYPTLVSDEGENGLPIPWSALSGLSHGRKKTELYAVEDSFYISSRIFRISTKDYPAVITDSIEIVDSDGVFAAVEPEGEFSSADLAAMINEDGTVNIDQEGIVYNEDDEIFWIAHEGRGTYGDENRPVESLNFLFKVDFKMGVIMEVVKLPTVVNEMQLRFGFEGVTMCDEYVVVAFQRRWGEEEYARIGMYNTETGEWKFGMYPLDEPESPNGGWVGLSDLSHVENGKFLVLERDNQGGPDAKVKRIYGIEIEDMDVFEDGTVIEKMLIRDIVPDLLMPNGLVYEKIEGIAVTQKGEVWIVNDNDGVDDNSGETQLLNLGKIF